MVFGIDQAIINYMIAYGGLGVIFFFGINWLQGGFLWTHLRVKAARGGKVLVGIRSRTDRYYRPGTLSGGTLMLKNRKGDGLRIAVPEGAFEHSMGVRTCWIDEVTNAIIMPNGKMISGFDAMELDNHCNALASKPNINSNKKELVVAALAIAAIIIGLYILYMQIDSLTQIVMELKKAGLVGNI